MAERCQQLSLPPQLKETRRGLVEPRFHCIRRVRLLHVLRRMSFLQLWVQIHRNMTDFSHGLLLRCALPHQRTSVPVSDMKKSSVDLFGYKTVCGTISKQPTAGLEAGGCELVPCRHAVRGPTTSPKTSVTHSRTWDNAEQSKLGSCRFLFSQQLSIAQNQQRQNW